MLEVTHGTWCGLILGMAVCAACGGSGSSADDDHAGDASASDAGQQESLGDAGGGDASVDAGGGGGGPVFPEEPVTTQYWMRSDMDVKMTSGVDSATMTLTAYSLVALTRSKSGYEMVDLQCQVATSHGKCAEGSPICTTLSAEAHEGQAYAASHRTLSFDGDHWTSSACAQAVGWKWSCTDGPQDTPIPTSDSDPLVYNPAGDDPNDVLKGVDLKITFESPSLPEPTWCITAAVQKVDVIYSGLLQDGDLALTGTVTDHGSAQSLLNDYCGTFDTPSAQGPGALRLVPKTFGGGNDATSWTCPSLEDFQAAFPQD